MSTPSEIVTDADIDRVHGYANFGSMKPRDVVNEGVVKAAFGYSSGSTQLAILRRHKLIRRLRPHDVHARLTKKGLRYLRAAYYEKFAAVVALGRAP